MREAIRFGFVVAARRWALGLNDSGGGRFQKNIVVSAAQRAAPYPHFQPAQFEIGSRVSVCARRRQCAAVSVTLLCATLTVVLS